MKDLELRLEFLEKLINKIEELNGKEIILEAIKDI